MSRFAVATAVLALLVGCNKGGPEIDPGTEDTRIDGNPGNNVDATSMEMCVNDSGEVFVVWVDDRDGTPDVWLNRSLDRGGSWLPTPVKINRGGDSSVFAPAIACTTDRVYVAWEDNRVGELENHQIFVSVSRDGGETWLQEDIRMGRDEEGLIMALGPQLFAINSEVYLAWYDNRNGAYDIFVSSSVDAGESWRAPERVDTDPAGSAYSAAPQIVATASGQVYVAWEDSRDGASDIYFARSDNHGVSFREDRRLDVGDDPGAYASFAPRIAADGNNVYVVWHDERNGDKRDIYFNYSPNGGADWRADAVRIDSTNAGFFNSIFPGVVVEGDVAHVVWQDARMSDVYDVYYRRLVAGEPTEEEVRVDTGNGEGINNSVNAVIAARDGTVVVGWEDYRGDAATDQDRGLVDLYYNYIGNDGVPDDRDYRLDSYPQGLTNKVDFRLDTQNGSVFAAWIDDRDLTYGVYFNALQLGEEAHWAEEQAD